uniref:DNA-directed RNA polymerase subunit alpha n=1 Tax=Enemion raddeanum TaxID=168836 RepID=A0A481Y0Y6_9MAGN|nr:RNA polymerase alpha subunit [Enemion raddeanum]QBK49378.1 RNA polymerase alpha subunit [Enemion raddeanum]
MLREEVGGFTWPLQWECVDSEVISKRLYYGRFVLSPLRKGQGDTIGIAMRRALLGEIEGTCITRVKSEKIPHEYLYIVGIEESIQGILMNLKELILRSNLYGTREASICVKGPGHVTAQDIILPPSVEIMDTTQHIATLTERVDLFIRLRLERGRGYRMKTPNNAQEVGYPIDAVFSPILNTSHSVHFYENEQSEILFLEIWTNGSLTPKEALYEAVHKLINLFTPLLHTEEQDRNLEDNQGRVTRVTVPLFTFRDTLEKLRKNNEFEFFKYIFIDQSELPCRTYNWLKRSNIHTLLDLVNYSEKDLIKTEHFRMEDVRLLDDIVEKHLSSILENHFIMDPPNT